MVELKENVHVVYFLVGIKTFEISVYVYKNPIFTNDVNNFETLRQIFL